MKSQTIQSPDGVRLLMENIWLRHKTGLSQKSDNVFFVELPPPTKDEIDTMATGESNHMGDTINIKSSHTGTIGAYLQQVRFDDILLEPNFDNRIYGNTIALYDAFSFLRSIDPCEVFTTSKLHIEPTLGSGILNVKIEMDLPGSWHEFLNRKVDITDETQISPERWIGALLLTLTNNGMSSIHEQFNRERFFEDEKRTCTSQSYSSSYIKNARYHEILSKIGLDFLLKRKVERLLNVATIFNVSRIGKNALKELLGNLYYDVVNANKMVVRNIRSYGSTQAVFDSINWALLYYDDEKLSPFSECVVICGSNIQRDENFSAALMKHFNTDKIFWISNDYDGIDLTFIRYNSK